MDKRVLVGPLVQSIHNSNHFKALLDYRSAYFTKLDVPRFTQKTLFKRNEKKRRDKIEIYDQRYLEYK